MEIPFDEVISEAVSLCLDNWTALNLALSNDWGSMPAKEDLRKRLIEDILNTEVDEQYLKELLEFYLEEHFNTQIQDQSAQEISLILLKVYEESCRNVSSELTRLRSLKGSQASASHKLEEEVPTLVEDMQELSLESPPAPAEPVVDEEGFSLVQSKKKRRQ